MRSWPDTLPPPSAPGYALTPVDSAIRTDMEVGAKRLRRITNARRDSLSVVWKFMDAEMAAFRAWFGDEAWSLAGDSDDLTGWLPTGVAIGADGIVGPDLALADRIAETATVGQHAGVRLLGAGAVAGGVILARATMRREVLTGAMLAFLDRAGGFHFTNVSLASGSLGSEGGLLSRTIENRGDGWWRVTITADVGTGATTPWIAIYCLNDVWANSYSGNPARWVDVCEVGCRMVTGYDLHLRTDAAGNVRGAAGGSAWFETALAFGGGLRRIEARFEGPWSAEMLPGFNWQVSAQLEVRNA